jgi:hypothetical protein
MDSMINKLDFKLLCNHNTGMKLINQLPQSELVYSLRRLSEAAKVVAYAKSDVDAEYFTLHYLRPLIQETETLLNNEKKPIN